MEFVRSRKAQSVLSSASSSEQPEGSFRLVEGKSDSSSAAVLFQKRQEVGMKAEKEEEEELLTTPAVEGMKN